jgi:hypothetical protein
MTRRKTIEEVRKVFQDGGCELLSTEYVNNRTKLSYICSCGNDSETSLDNFSSGKRCIRCKSEKARVQNTKYSISDIERVFADNGCKLLAYTNINTSIKYVCSCGELGSSRFHNFINGARCGECAKAKQIESKIEVGNAPVSLPQVYISNLIDGELNYQVGKSMLDIALPKEKTYIEYDGSGHWLRVVHGSMTEEEFIAKEKRRHYALRDLGWKEIRIQSKGNRIPEDDAIKSLIEDAKEHLRNGHSWYFIDLDKSFVKTSLGTRSIKVGRLRRITEV